MRAIEAAFAALLAAAVFCALAEPSPYLSLASLSWVKRPSSPGGVGVVRLAVAVYGTQTLLNARARVSAFAGCQVVGGAEVQLGSMSPGSPKSFDVALNFTGGTCYLSVLVSYEAAAQQAAAGYSVSSVPGSLSLEVGLKPVYEPSFAVSVSPSSLSPGSVSNVTVAVANNGFSDVHSVDASVSVSGAALLESANPLVVNLGQLPAGGAKTLQLKLLPTSPTVTLTVRLGYVDASGSYGESTFSCAIPVSQSALLVSLEPPTLPTASATDALLLVRNLGGETLRNATLYFSAQPGSAVVIEPAAVPLGDLGPGGIARARVTVKVPYGERGARSIPFTLVYIGGDGGLRVVRDALTFVAVEEARVAVTSVEVSPAKPVAGSVVTLSVTVMNLGSSPVYGVNVTIVPPEGLAPLRSPYYFIGQLSPFTPTAVPFSLRVERPGSYRVSVIVDYAGYYGEQRRSAREVSFEAAAAAVSASETREGGGSGVLPAVAAVVALAAAGILAYRRAGRGGAG